MQHSVVRIHIPDTCGACRRISSPLLRSEESLEELLRGRGLALGLLGGLRLQALLLEEFLTANGLGVRVEAEEHGLVDKRVLLLCPGAFLDLLASRANDGLDFVAVDEAGDVGVGDLGSGEDVILLKSSSLLEGAVDIIKEAESTLGPDDESSKVTTGSELKKIQSPDVDNFDTRQVAESLNNAIILVVDNKRTTALTVPTVPQLSLSSTELTRVGNLDNIGVSTQGLEEGNSLLGLFEGLGGVSDNERNFLDLLDTVTTSEDKGREGGGGKGRDNSEAALVLVDLDVPFAPGLGRSEHASTTAHVTESSLTGAVSSSTSYTGNTSDGTTSTPRFSASLVSSLLADGISLPLVLGNALVDLRDDIEPDGCSENCRQGKGGGCLARGGADVDGGS